MNAEHEVLFLFLMICLNIVVLRYYNRKAFAVLFMLFEITFALSIINLYEIYVAFLLTFAIMFNILAINTTNSNRKMR